MCVPSVCVRECYTHTHTYFRVLSRQKHCVRGDHGSLPDLHSDDGKAVMRIFRREQVDGLKLFGTTAGRAPDAKVFNRLVLDMRLKGWGIKDAASRSLISAFCYALCQENVRRVFDISDPAILTSPQRIDLLVHIAAMPPPGEGEFRGKVRDEWPQIAVRHSQKSAP